LPGYDAFISHASDDREKAEQIAASLEEHDLRCWMAPRDLRTGREYAEEIMYGIRESRCLVLVLSEAANQSPMVRREVERAVSLHKPVFPIRVEEVVPSHGLEFFVSATHWLDAWQGALRDHMDRLVRDLTAAEAERQPAPAAPARRRASHRRTALAIGAAALVFGGVIGAAVIADLLTDDETEPEIDQTNEDPAASFDPLAHYGVDPSQVTRDDFSISVVPDQYGDAVSLMLDYRRSAVRNAAAMGTLYVAVDDGEYIDMGAAAGPTVMLRDRIAQAQLAGAKQIGIRFAFAGSDTVLGPFVYDVDPGAAMEQRSTREIDQRASHWIKPANGYLTIDRLREFADEIDTVRYGAARDDLAFSIDVPRGLSPEDLDRFFRRRFVHPPEAKMIYVQITLRDGSTTAINEFDARDWDMPAESLRLDVIASDPPDAKLPAYLYITRGRANLIAQTAWPADRMKVSYGGFAPELVEGPDRGGWGPALALREIPMGEPSITLISEDAQRNIVASVEYDLSHLPDMMFGMLKETFCVNIGQWAMVQRIVVSPEILEENDSAGEPKDARDLQERRNRSTTRQIAFHRLQEVGVNLRTLEAGEWLVLHSDDFYGEIVAPSGEPFSYGSQADLWRTVARAELGPAPDRLEVRVPIEVAAEAESRLKEPPLHIFLDPSWQEVHIRYVFTDGEATDTIRLPIEVFKFGIE